MMLVIPLLSCSVFAGPWPRKQGKGFVQLGFSTIGYDQVYRDDATKSRLAADVRDNVVQAFADFGVTDNITVTAMIPFKFISATPQASNQSKVTNSGIGDIDVAVRRNWINKNGYAFSTEVQLGLPTGDQVDANGLVLGDGESNVAVRILGGRSFYPSPLYVTVDVAYNFRAKGFSDDVFYNAEIGYGFVENRLLVMVLLSGRESTSTKPTPMNAATELGLLTFNQEYTAIIPKVLYKFDEGWGISASYATAVHGRNVAGGAVLAGGVFLEF
jgi:hypothetical protein